MGLIILVLIAGVVLFILQSRKNRASERYHQSLSEYRKDTANNLAEIPKISSLDEENDKKHNEKIWLNESNESEPLSQARSTKDYSLEGNHYRKLRQFLENGQWEAANEETNRLFKEFTRPDAEPDEWTIRQVSEIHEVPSEIINNVDYLWIKFSHGKLGFSAQKRVLESTPLYDYYSFAEKIGWYSQTNKSWDWKRISSDDNLITNLEDMPVGHLPAISGLHMYGIRVPMSEGLHSFTSSRLKPFFYFMDKLLGTAKGIDYSYLRNLLAEEHWNQADQETAKKINELMQTLVFSESKEVTKIDKRMLSLFPQQDIETIDSLWHQYSGGKFGIGVQKRIYIEEKGDHSKFLERIGWSNERQSLIESSTISKFDLPYGFFPLRVWLLDDEKASAKMQNDLQDLFAFLEISKTPIDESLQVSDELDSFLKIPLMLQIAKRKQQTSELLETMLESGTYSYGSRLCQEAIDLLEEMNSIWPKNPQVLTQLSSIYLFCSKAEETGDPDKAKREKLEEAILYADQAIEMDPNYEDAWNIKGKAYLSLGPDYFGGYEFEQAVYCFDKAISIRPHENHLFDKGIAYFFINEHEEAIKYFKQALNLNPYDDTRWFWQGYALLKRSKQIEILPEIYDQELRIPCLKDAIYCCQKAIENCRTPIQLQPQGINYWLTLGEALADLGQISEALEAYDIAIKLNDCKKIPLYDKGKLLLKIGDYQRGLLCFDEILNRFELMPTIETDLFILPPSIFWNKAICHLHLMEEDEALHLEGILECLMFNNEYSRNWIRDEIRDQKCFSAIQDRPRFRDFLKEKHLESWWFDV